MNIVSKYAVLTILVSAIAVAAVTAIAVAAVTAWWLTPTEPKITTSQYWR